MSSANAVVSEEPKELKFYALISAFLVSMLLLSNVISGAKFISMSFIPGLEWVTLSASVLTYPFVFLGGDILTEIYGYDRTRRVIWAGFVVFIISTLLIALVGIWPSASFWDNQKAYDEVFGAVPRVLVASFLAYLTGEFMNSYVLAKLKVLMSKNKRNQNSYFATSSRIVSSTFVGQFFDSIIFFPIAFYASGKVPDSEIPSLIIASWLCKTAWEALFVPITVPLIAWLKKVENIDYLDTDTDFKPWHIK